jgi:hypothetical protein
MLAYWQYGTRRWMFDGEEQPDTSNKKRLTKIRIATHPLKKQRREQRNQLDEKICPFCKSL